MWNDLENRIISCVDDTILYAEVASPSDSINDVDFLNRYLLKNRSWCLLLELTLIPAKHIKSLSVDLGSLLML